MTVLFIAALCFALGYLTASNVSLRRQGQHLTRQLNPPPFSPGAKLGGRYPQEEADAH